MHWVIQRHILPEIGQDSESCCALLSATDSGHNDTQPETAEVVLDDDGTCSIDSPEAECYYEACTAPYMSGVSMAQPILEASDGLVNGKETGNNLARRRSSSCSSAQLDDSQASALLPSVMDPASPLGRLGNQGCSMEDRIISVLERGTGEATDAQVSSCDSVHLIGALSYS